MGREGEHEGLRNGGEQQGNSVKREGKAPFDHFLTVYHNSSLLCTNPEIACVPLKLPIIYGYFKFALCQGRNNCLQHYSNHKQVNKSFLPHIVHWPIELMP